MPPPISIVCEAPLTARPNDAMRSNAPWIPVDGALSNELD